MSSFFINFQLVLYLSFISLYVYHECQHAPLRILLIHSNQFYIFWRTSQKIPFVLLCLGSRVFFLTPKGQLNSRFTVYWMDEKEERREKIKIKLN